VFPDSRQPNRRKLQPCDFGTLNWHPRSNNFGTLLVVTRPANLFEEIESMRRIAKFASVALVAWTTVLTITVLTTDAWAAQGSTDAVDRKVTQRVAPVFPELARRMHIHGAVKVEVVIRPNGIVKSTRVLGGNPVLVDAAADAVKKWKFETGPNETTQVVQITFESQ
jgi:TonB family protein